MQLKLPALNRSGWRDLLGITASIACAIHCAAMPLVIGFLPSLGLSFLAGEAFHQWMALICFLIAIGAFAPGWKKHKSLIPGSVGALGLVLVTSTAFLFADTCCPPVAVASETAGEANHVCTEACCQVGNESRESEDASDMTKLDAGSRMTMASLTPIGGVLLIVGHCLNRRLCCACDCCSSEGSDSVV